jgi:hypothetical protein
MPRAEPNKRKLNVHSPLTAAGSTVPSLGYISARPCGAGATHRTQGLEVHLQIRHASTLVSHRGCHSDWAYRIPHLASQVMYQVAQGKDPAAERRAQRGAGTFEELATQYRAYAERKNKSWKQADKLVRRNLIPSWETKACVRRFHPWRPPPPASLSADTRIRLHQRFRPSAHFEKQWQCTA